MSRSCWTYHSDIYRAPFLNVAKVTCHSWLMWLFIHISLTACSKTIPLPIYRNMTYVISKGRRNCHVCIDRTWCESTWWRHKMETFSTLLAICPGNSSLTSEFPAQTQVTRNFNVFFDLRLNKQLSKHLWGWWFETPSGHYDVTVMSLLC